MIVRAAAADALVLVPRGDGELPGRPRSATSRSEVLRRARALAGYARAVRREHDDPHELAHRPTLGALVGGGYGA